jgi:hypothetical protein
MRKRDVFIVASSIFGRNARGEAAPLRRPEARRRFLFQRDCVSALLSKMDREAVPANSRYLLTIGQYESHTSLTARQFTATKRSF